MSDIKKMILNEIEFKRIMKDAKEMSVNRKTNIRQFAMSKRRNNNVDFYYIDLINGFEIYIEKDYIIRDQGGQEWKNKNKDNRMRIRPVEDNHFVFKMLEKKKYCNLLKKEKEDFYKQNHYNEESKVLDIEIWYKEPFPETRDILIITKSDYV